jgi:predicted dehydrogenase
MSELGVGVVGLGWVAGAHLDTFKRVPGLRVRAVCSRRAQDPAELERRFGSPLVAYRDLDAMLADRSIDVVDLCTPHPLHAGQAIAAARAGKHLMIEKPLALSWEDAKAVREAVRKAGVQACVCFEWRWCAQAAMTRSLLSQGLLGELHYGEVDYLHGIGPEVPQFEWNVKKDWGGSSLLTAGCHALDALLGFMGEPVEEVTSLQAKSRSAVYAPYEYPGTSVTLIRFRGGRVGKVASVVDCRQPYYFHVYLVGSEGSLLDTKFYSAKVGGLDPRKWSALEVVPDDSEDVSNHPYLGQFRAFEESIRTKAPMPLTDLETALESHRVIYAADLSAARGETVRMAEMK